MSHHNHHHSHEIDADVIFGGDSLKYGAFLDEYGNHPSLKRNASSSSSTSESDRWSFSFNKLTIVIAILIISAVINFFVFGGIAIYAIFSAFL